MPTYKPKALIVGDEVSEGLNDTSMWEKGKKEKKRYNLFYNREEQHRNAVWRGVRAYVNNTGRDQGS